jgi:chromosome segregation ATPase
MALFKSSNPEKSLQRDIDAAAKNRERLSAQLSEIEHAVTRHAAAAKQAAVTGNDADLDRAEGALRAAQDRSATLKAALADVEQQLAALERTKAEMADRKLRAQTAADIELLVRKLTEVGAEFTSTTERLSEHTRQAVPLVYEALGIDDFMKTCLTQVPEALELVNKLLRAHADAVVAGTAPATLPLPQDEASVPPAQPPETPRFTYQVVKQEPTYRGFVAG